RLVESPETEEGEGELERRPPARPEGGRLALQLLARDRRGAREVARQDAERRDLRPQDAAQVTMADIHGDAQPLVDLRERRSPFAELLETRHLEEMRREIHEGVACLAGDLDALVRGPCGRPELRPGAAEESEHDRVLCDQLAIAGGRRGRQRLLGYPDV